MFLTSHVATLFACIRVYWTLSWHLFTISLCKTILGQFSHVFLAFSASGFRCSPLYLLSSTVKLVVLGPTCIPLDPRTAMVKLALPCISNVFWIEGSTVSAIAVVVALCIWKFKLVLISLGLLDNGLEISSLIILVVSRVISLFSLQLLSSDLKSSPVTFEFCWGLLDCESEFS